MKKVVFLAFLCSFLVVLDNSLMPFININIYYPSLLFVFIICYSILNGTKEAVIIGILTGVLQDAFFVGGIGINILTNMLMCIVAAYIGQVIFTHKVFIPTVTCFGASLFKGIMVGIILAIIKQSFLFEAILYTSLYNMFISIFMYKIVYKICNIGFMKKDWSF